MKTRSEMIYDFMMAFCTNPAFFSEGMTDEMSVLAVYAMASRMADKVLENL